MTNSGTTFGWARVNLREVVGDGPQLAGPVWVGGVDRELFEDDLGDTVEHCGLVRYVSVEHCGVAAHRFAEAAHGQAVRTVAVDDRQRCLQDERSCDLAVVGSGGRGQGVTIASSGFIRPGWLFRHWRSTSLLRRHCRPFVWVHTVDSCSNLAFTRFVIRNRGAVMLVIIGLVVLLVAVIVAIVGVLTNSELRIR